MLGDYYFMKVNFTDLSVASSRYIDTSNTLALALSRSKDNIENVYEVHLWNYCATTKSQPETVHNCSAKQSEYFFDPITVWDLNTTETQTSAASSNNALTNAENAAKSKEEQLENALFGKTAKDALDAYRKAAKVMFILYAVSFWATALTIFLGIFAIFSRWGSFCTWIVAVISSICNLAAAGLSTAIYETLSVALRKILDDYHVDVDVGKHALAVTWLSVLFSCAATLFWLFSICCCSGRSNPHHRNNKGGLWNAEPKGQGYGSYGGRGMRVEKTGGYERVAEPFLAHGEEGDRVPLRDYPQQGNSSYEPFRHS